LAHGANKFPAHNIDHLLDAFLSERRKTPYVRPSHTYGARSHGKRLEYTAATANTAVDQDRYLITYRVDHFRKALDRRAQSFGRATAMIRDENAVDTALISHSGVFAGLNAFEKKLDFGELA
jgi:hypothetical protein